MKVGVSINTLNTPDWDRVKAEDWSRSPDLPDGLLCASTSPESMQIAADRGLGQLFVTGAPLAEVSRQVGEFNTIRARNGLPPQQPTVYMWAHCVETEAQAADAQKYFQRYQLEVADHYGFTKPDNFKGLKGYERYHESQQRQTN